MWTKSATGCGPEKMVADERPTKQREIYRKELLIWQRMNSAFSVTREKGSDTLSHEYGKTVMQRARREGQNVEATSAYSGQIFCFLYPSTTSRSLASVTLGTSYLKPIFCSILLPSTVSELLYSSSWSRYGVRGELLICDAFRRLDHGSRCVSLTSSVTDAKLSYNMLWSMALLEKQRHVNVAGTLAKLEMIVPWKPVSIPKIDRMWALIVSWSKLSISAVSA